MAIVYRPATLDDAAFAADVYTAVRPDSPVDPKELRHEWAHPGDTWTMRSFVMERDGGPIGVAAAYHPLWEKVERRFGATRGEVLPEHGDAATMAAMLTAMERLLVADGADLVRTRAAEDDQPRIDVIRSLGYREDRRARRWELDLVANRERIERMAEGTRARMREQGVRLLTFADDDDPDVARKIWRLSSEADEDVPTTIPHVEETLDDYLRWFDAPNMRRDRFWLAREGADVVGVSVLGYPPVRGIVGTEWTATARRVRGRGIARAVKVETLMQAIALGVDRVRTGNDAANEPILHINRTMGYRPIPGGIDFLKDV
jgi:GNAT superfamily N-acetyltransferase